MTAPDWRCRATTKTGAPCRSPFQSSNNPEYCSRHDPEMDEFWREASGRGGENRKRVRSTCALDGCHKKLGKGRSKWCSDECAQLGTQRAKTERNRLASGRRPLATQTRRPPDMFFDQGWDKMVDTNGHPSVDVQRDCAQYFNVERNTVNRWYAYCRQRVVDTRGAGDWTPPPRNFPEAHWDLTVDDIPALVADFLDFRETHFTTPRGKPYETPEFQQVWVAALLFTLVTGGRQVILSPPRHGKTELLIHICEWLICRFPNIRILWVGGNERIAKRSVRNVARGLTNNKGIISRFLPPGQSFKPAIGSGLTWSADEFTVDCRTIDEIKGATMTALGRGGTLLSLDADIIVADDIEDHGSTAQPGSREGTRDWWTSDLESRKEEHTGLFSIGSRVHVDDLNGHLVENEEYEAITETAHDPNCELDPLDPALYDAHVDCMLFPSLRSYRWLMGQKRAAQAAGGLARFNMVYLGIVSGDGLTIFVAAEIVACRSRSYTLGTLPTPYVPEGHPPDDPVGMIRLVGGLDPSGSGYQAAFLWAYQVRPVLKMWMMMLENQQGGGIAAARETIKDWHTRFGLLHWVVEENLYQGGIVKDEGIVAMKAELGIVVEPHRTQFNKWDPELGVSTLRPLFQDRTITLPYSDPASVAASELYQAQLVHFSNAPRNRNTRTGPKTDVVMASWFPMTVIRRARAERLAEMGVHYPATFRSFTGNRWNTVPWKDPMRRSA